MKKILFSLIFLIVVSVSVKSLGVATVYGSEKIEIPQGTENYEYYFIVQNMESSPKTVNIDIASDENIAKMREKGNVFEVPAMTREMKFYLDLDIPRGSKVGDKYEVAYVVKAISDNNQGQVSIGQSITKRFTVTVVENTEENKAKLWFKGFTGDFLYVFDKITGDSVFLKVIIIVVPLGLVVFLVYFFLKKKKSKKEELNILDKN